MKKYNGEKYIVSFTSFGQRFDDACKMIYGLQKQSYKNFHLVITIYEGDMKDISLELQHAQQFDLAKHNNAPMQYRADVTKMFNDQLVGAFSL